MYIYETKLLLLLHSLSSSQMPRTRCVFFLWCFTIKPMLFLPSSCSRHTVGTRVGAPRFSDRAREFAPTDCRCYEIRRKVSFLPFSGPLPFITITEENPGEKEPVGGAGGGGGLWRCIWLCPAWCLWGECCGRVGNGVVFEVCSEQMEAGVLCLQLQNISPSIAVLPARQTAKTSWCSLEPAWFQLSSLLQVM